MQKTFKAFVSLSDILTTAPLYIYLYPFSPDSHSFYLQSSAVTIILSSY